VNADKAEIAVRGIATFSGIPLFALSIRQRPAAFSAAKLRFKIA
jgi:hypothetical protein